MNKQWKQVAVLVVGVLIPGMSQAEYYSSSPSVAADASRVQSIIKPITDKKPGVGAEALREELESGVRELEEKIITNEKEKSLNNQVGVLRQGIDQLKQLTSLPSLIMANKVKKDRESNQNIQQLFTSSTANPGTGMQPADADTSSLEASCSKNVDLTQTQSLSGQSVQSLEELKRNGGKFLSEKDEELKEKAFENTLAAIKQIQDSNKKNKSQQQNEFQPDLSSFVSLDPSQPSQFEDEQRLARLEAKKQELEKSEKVWTDKVLDETVKMLKGLREFSKDKEKVRLIADTFATSQEQFRSAFERSALTADGQLYKNCKRQAEELGRDNPLAPNTLLNSAFQTVVAYHLGDANYYALPFLRSLSGTVRGMQCPKTQQQIQSLVGAPLQGRINQIRSITDPQTLIQTALASTNEMLVAQAQVGQAFNQSKQACNSIAKFNKKVKDFIGNTQQQIAQQAQQQPGGVPHRNPTRGIVNTNPAHLGAGLN